MPSDLAKKGFNVKHPFSVSGRPSDFFWEFLKPFFERIKCKINLIQSLQGRARLTLPSTAT